MALYTMFGADGKGYGPVDEATLSQWARESRVASSTSIRCEADGRIVAAGTLPFLAGLFVAAPTQAYAPAAPQQAYYAYSPQVVPMGSPQAAMHWLSSFSVAGVVLLHLVTMGLFPMIWFNIMHGKMPMTRQDDPSAGKAIGFMFIPFFNFYWIFFTYLRLIDRINYQRAARGLPETLHGFTLAICILSVIPYVNYVNFLFIAPIWAGMMQASVNELVAVTAAQNAQNAIA